MKLIVGLFLLAIICISIACNNAGAPPANTANANANTGNTAANSNAAANTATAPSKDVLAAREKQAFEAWKGKDGKFFDGFLIPNFVMMDGAYRGGKADTVKMISENPCTVGSYSMSDEKVTNVSPQVAVITMKVTADVTCEGKKMPSPVTSVSVYVREGNEWKGAYHTEVPILSQDAKPAPPPPMPPSPPLQANASLAATLIEREKFIWDAWKEHDAAKVGDFLTNDASAVEMGGSVLATKADIVKSWTTPCDVKDIKITNEHAAEISPGVALFLYKGSATGKCGDFPVMPQWATTVYVKEGDTWKGAFFVAAPA